MKKCDIIIPIYNAYDCVIECVESVLKNTKFDGNYLILINDASPDKNIRPLLDGYAKKYKHIVYLENKQNLGFVGTVNKGMKYSKNDVLLLNSDTEVTAKWLDKISKCAYSSDDIATVTPLSNNATLASVPKSYEPNDLPAGYTLERMGELVEKCSYNDYPEIPTGHGFCLYIKREVLDKVGYFDYASFGKGYGEENDFCFRCYEFGYRHILCDNTYILHKESKSFLESKKDLILNASKTLQKKHPEYTSRLQLWNEKKPIQYIGNNIAIAIGNEIERPNILFIIHDWQSDFGGTTLHCKDLIKNMRDKYNFHIFTFENGVYKVYSYFEEAETVVKYPRISQSIKILNYYNKDYHNLLSKIIDDYKISFVHIHHLIWHYFDVANVFKEKNIKYMITLHDFYCQCPLVNKLYKEEKYCKNPSNKKCNECLLYKYNTPIDIKSWRKYWLKLLHQADYIITPSEFTKKEILNIYNDIKLTVIEHGVDLKKVKSNLTIENKFNDIAFIGAIGIHKGRKLLEKFIQKNMLAKIRVHLFGITDSTINKSNNHYFNHGPYVRSDIKKLLHKNNIKLVCLFSICPETYSYTLTEAIACGIPVIGYNFGTIAERIKKDNLGWIIDANLKPEEIAQFIMDIFSNPNEYKKVVESINRYKIKTTKKMSQSYEKIYKKYATLNGKIHFDFNYFKSVNQIVHENYDYNALVNEKNNLINMINNIYTSKGYKMLNKVYIMKDKILRRNKKWSDKNDSI